MAYIGNEHITSKVIKIFLTNDSSAFDTYHALADDELVRVGKVLGVAESSFETDSSGYIEDTFCQEYLASWFCMRYCKDNIGVNNVLLEEDKYYKLYEYYKQDVSEMLPKISAQMLSVDEDSQDRIDYMTSLSMLIR